MSETQPSGLELCTQTGTVATLKADAYTCSYLFKNFIHRSKKSKSPASSRGIGNMFLIEDSLPDDLDDLDDFLESPLSGETRVHLRNTRIGDGGLKVMYNNSGFSLSAYLSLRSLHHLVFSYQVFVEQCF